MFPPFRKPFVSVESSTSSTPSSGSRLTGAEDDKPCFELLMFLQSDNAERRNGLTYDGTNNAKKRNIMNKIKISKTFDIIYNL